MENSAFIKALQKIIDNDLLNNYSEYICHNLNITSRKQLLKYKDLAKVYALNNWSGLRAWWEYGHEDINYVIAEKYRFIKDLIEIIKTKTQ